MDFKFQILLHTLQLLFLLFYSGAITKHFVTAKTLMANFILEAFFSPSQVRKYINDKSRTYLTAEQIGK